jgi:predicted  nucleic acid-binding Zn-ribbon protein
VVAILATVMAVGLAAAAVSIALWLKSSGDLEDVEARVDDRDKEIAQLQEDLEAAEAQVAELEGPAAEAETLQECIDALNEYYSTAAGSDEEATALEAIDVACTGLIF